MGCWSRGDGGLRSYGCVNSSSRFRDFEVSMIK